MRWITDRATAAGDGLVAAGCGPAGALIEAALRAGFALATPFGFAAFLAAAAFTARAARAAVRRALATISACTFFRACFAAFLPCFAALRALLSTVFARFTLSLAACARRTA